MSQDPLLTAAERLAASDRPLTFEALANAAGVSRATVYRRFRDREGLAKALAQRGVTIEAPVDANQRVLSAVKEVLLEQGFDALTLRAVAERAGVAEATVYRRFKDREGLIAAFADSTGTRQRARTLLV